MTDATYFASGQAPAQDQGAQVHLPRPQPFSTPVLMADAITPLAGETVLSLLWKRLEKSGDDGF